MTTRTGKTRQLRADAERGVQVILAAAERVLAADPAATMEEIATEAGMSRATVHRRFATREQLLDTLAEHAVGRINAAVDAVPLDTMPPVLGMYQATANVLRAKSAWRFAVSDVSGTNPATAAMWHTVMAKCDAVLRRAHDTGLVRADVDLGWARSVFTALVNEAHLSADGDPDALAARVVDTLLHGLGPKV